MVVLGSSFHYSFHLGPETKQPSPEKAPKKPENFRQRRQKFEKLREVLQESEFDEDPASEAGLVRQASGPAAADASSLSSAGSSVAGASGVQRVPFRIIEDDAVSHRTTASLGVLSRVPSNNLAAARQLSSSSGSLSVCKTAWNPSLENVPNATASTQQ